ncbi:hypothetical protein GGG87_04405 [Streptococcus sp. zg-86]|uniref:Uncharacterized protein n=1 Tax=Streptococcus zhangguiae TaxID=2664091 RepID=A0A6I4RIB3_9STRE|nr:MULTISPECIES: hypothetical protein [unclassified Streptococcus]MTB64246.1 hypothetical protein [Streptococcus sp. zg-86]MTB90428.1 hypothetical protein [Streptococcus sp. zg-36]MWV56233.1 hypothetical protein [Streptococcus sp. zg-70]QTH48145.1 hypothetical protein J5M87_02120 [Streptococcus sp. zg-86]
MKFNNLIIEDGFYSKTFYFGDKTAIYSNINSVGKSTLLRLLFYSIGYSIPSTKKIKFNKLETRLHLETVNGNCEIHRKDKKIRLKFIDSEEWELNMPNDLEFILQKIFNTKNQDVLSNILGAIYLDQDKGWTLLNRGTVIGGIKFKIEQLIQGLSEIDALESLNIELEEVGKEISKLKQLKKIIDFQNENIQIANESNFETTKLLNLENEVSIIKGERKSLELKRNDLKGTLKKNEEYLSYIENLNLLIKAPNSGEEFLLKKEYVKDFGTYQELIELRIYHLEKEIDKLNDREEKLKIEINHSEKLFVPENPLKLFEERLNLLVAPQEVIVSELERLKKREKELKIIRNNYLSNKITQDIYESIMYFANKLGVQDYLNSEKDFILTSDLKSYSGTILHKLVFCFKLSYILELEKFLDFKLPIVLDSPSGREVDQKNIEDMFKILNEDFVDNQIIIASIFQYPSYLPEKIIRIREKLLE